MAVDKIEKYGFHVVMTVLLALIAYIWQGNQAKLVELEKSLNLVRLEIISVKSAMMTDARVHELIELEFAKRGTGK